MGQIWDEYPVQTREFQTPFLVRFLRIRCARNLRLTDAAVEADGGRLLHIAPGNWIRAKWFFWSRILFEPSAGFPMAILLSEEEADDFLELVEACRVRAAQHGNIGIAAGHLARWSELLGRDRYLAHHEVQGWMERATPVHVDLFASLAQIELVEPGTAAAGLATVLRDPFALAEKRNVEFVQRELLRQKPWFDSFQPGPTDVQREVAVRDETNSLVVAGAGTGKTSTIVTKIRYLLRRKITPGSNILVVAFNTDAAEEIRERCAAEEHEEITVLTFHALGLKILAHAPGEKPPVLTEVATEESRDDLIDRLISELSADAGYAEDYARFVLLYPRPVVTRFESKSESAYVARSKPALTKSLGGDWVRSTEELRVANWLHLHGIPYQYEEVYPHPNHERYTRYRPDFTIRIEVRDSDGKPAERVVYLEHQALNEKGEAPEWMPRYAEKVAFCRATHQQHGTRLVESFSWWFKQGIWERELRAKLTAAGIPLPVLDWPETLAKVEAADAVTLNYARRATHALLRRILDLRRATAEPAEINGGDRPPPLEKLNVAHATDRNRKDLFQRLLLPLARAYEAHKQKRQGVDFEDMIYLARKAIARGQFPAPWTHYIIDEFQDASLSRLALIQALRSPNPDSRLTCVGDDWQAIIRFAGGDIRAMTQFRERVGPFWRANLDRAFRYSSVIAQVSSGFVLANPHQLKKSIQPAAGRQNVPVRIVLAGSLGEDGEFNDVLFKELEAIRKIKGDAMVLLLSRYRHGVLGAEDQARIRASFPGLTLEWSTVHKAKGRESDAVIVGDLNDGNLGFPCLKEDDPIIHDYLPPEDDFAQAEERRLFYVALTRARQQVSLIADASAPSSFVCELMEGPAYRALIEVHRSGEPAKLCPRCKSGYLVARDGPNGLFYACTKGPACPHTENACSKCRRGFLQQVDGRFVCSRIKSGCDHTARACPKCHQGMLVVKVNRTNGNEFLGCSRFFDEEAPCSYTQNLSARRRW